MLLSIPTSAVCGSFDRTRCAAKLAASLSEHTAAELAVYSIRLLSVHVDCWEFNVANHVDHWFVFNASQKLIFASCFLEILFYYLMNCTLQTVCQILGTVYIMYLLTYDVITRACFRLLGKLCSSTVTFTFVIIDNKPKCM